MAETQVIHRAVLDAVPPFDLRQSIRAMAGFAPCTGEQRLGAASVRKAVTVVGADVRETAVVVDVCRRADRASGVALTVHGCEPLGPDEVAAAELAASRWLGLDDDTAPFLQLAAADPVLRDIGSAATGLHQVRFASLAEGAAYFVLTQRTPQRIAAARKRRLAAEHGTRIAVDGVAYVAFPGLTRLAGLEPATLGAFAGNPRQADYLVEAVRALADLDEEWLRSAPYDEVDESLRSIRGVGDFTASAIMLRVLGRPDGLPMRMAQFTGLATQLYGHGTRLESVREHYGEHLGWWAYFAKTAAGWANDPTLARTA